MIVILLVLFTGFCTDKLILFILLTRDLSDLSFLLRQRLEAGSSDLAFMAGARGGTGITEFFLPIRALVLTGGYIGALLFFFHQRKAGR